MVLPEMVMVLLMSTVLSPKTPLIAFVESVTASAPMTPSSDALVVSRREVASAVASYWRSFAVIPKMLSCLAVMLAVVFG